MVPAFTTTATKETDLINKYIDINYVSSTSEPVIFIPVETQGFIVYGSQKKPNSSKPVEALDSGEWKYETDFRLEEEF